MFSRGFVANVLNPKAVIFYLAFLPNFIAPERPLLMQYAIISITGVGINTIVMICYGAFAARIARVLSNPTTLRLVNRTFALLFCAIAIALLVSA